MRRREFVMLAGSVVAGWPVAVRGQQKAAPVIGYLGINSPRTDAANSTYLTAFHHGLGEAGYVGGRNVAIEYRWTEGHYDRLPALAADLVGRKVDVIVANGTPATTAAKNATLTIPVLASAGDLVAAGLVTSLARPGGNVTGVSLFSRELMPKRLELLSELVPQVGVIVLLVNPSKPTTKRMIREVQRAAGAKGVQLHILNANTASTIDAAFAALVQLHARALVVASDPFFAGRREQLLALAARHAVPAIYEFRIVAEAGGLMSYGPSLAAAYRQVGIYAGKILGGTKLADLPVEQPTTFELVINLRTAKALGLAIPASILARADEVIE